MDSVWKQEQVEIAPERVEIDHGTWDVDRDDEGSRRSAEERVDEEARERAFADFYAGPWAPRTDTSGWPARYVEAYKTELERLERERQAALKRIEESGGPAGPV